MNFEVPSEGHLHWTEEEYKDGISEVWKTIWILSFVTVAEVGLALAYDAFVGDNGPRWLINIAMAVASVIKVYFIMGTFMHLKHEKKWFILTVFLPFLFLIWAIIAFVMDGNSWGHMRTLMNLF